AAFMAAVMSSDMDNTDKVVTMVAECRDMGLEVSVPDINRCHYEFIAISDEVVLYGIGAIKGIGESAIGSILEAREQGGSFSDLFDFCRRINLRKVNKRVLESLIRSGALDALGTHRASLMATLHTALQVAGQHSKDQEAGQGDIFGSSDLKTPAHKYVLVPEWSEDQRLGGEKDTLGLYLSGHPIARFEKELAHITGNTIANLNASQSNVVVAGLIVAIRTMRTRRGDRMAFVTLDDRTGRLELAVFSDLYQASRDLLTKDNLMVVDGHLSVDEYTGGFKMRADKLYTMDEARAGFADRLVIDVNIDLAGNGFVSELKQILAPVMDGPCPVYLNYSNNDAEAEILLGEQWKVNPTASVLEKLEGLAGEKHVHVIYP
ncbi:MAG: OB-fold nucleic acid binding domain-containing protein, partial [Acidiferrobacterales bacterium]